MGQRKMFGISWKAERRAAWRTLAARLHKNETELGRRVIEEFMSCYLGDQELVACGMAEYVGLRQVGLLDFAIARAKQTVNNAPLRRATDLPLPIVLGRGKARGVAKAERATTRMGSKAKTS